MTRKERFLKRNKRSACRKAQQRRLLRERKNAKLSSATVSDSNASSSTSTTNAGAAINVSENASATTNAATQSTAGDDAMCSKRPPERVGSVIGCENFIINDRDEIKLNMAGRQVFLVNKNHTLFKLNSLRRAKKSHSLVTQRKYKRFQRFAQRWLADHVSEQQQQLCNDWLLGKTLEATTTPATTTATAGGNTANAGSNNNWTLQKTRIVLQNDVKKTPYRIYNRYKVAGNNGNVNISNASSNSTLAAITNAQDGNIATTTATTTAGTATVLSATLTQHCNNQAANATGNSGSNTNATPSELPQVRPIES